MGTDTKLGHLSQAELVRVLDELAKLDFLNMQCTEKMRLDHGSFPTVTLVVPSGTASVVLEDCWNHEPALRDIVEHVKDLADRATAD